MARPKYPSPYTLRVTMHDVGDDHHEIEVGAKLNVRDVHLDTGYTVAYVTAGYRWIAGIAARIAVALSFDLAEAGYTHRCQYPSGCGVSGSATMVHPEGDFGDPPGAWICVPTKDRVKWLARVRALLREILAADESVPTEAEEAAFANPPPRQPWVAPALPVTPDPLAATQRPSAPVTEDESPPAGRAPQEGLQRGDVDQHEGVTRVPPSGIETGWAMPDMCAACGYGVGLMGHEINCLDRVGVSS